MLDPLGDVKEGEKEGERVKDKEGERQKGRQGKRKMEGERECVCLNKALTSQTYLQIHTIASSV